MMTRSGTPSVQAAQLSDRPDAPELGGSLYRRKTARNYGATSFSNADGGRLIFAHTFLDHEDLAEVLREERGGQRDVAFYVREPHVVLAHAPQHLFLDPSHTFRLWSDRYEPASATDSYIEIRRARTREDVEAVNTILAGLGMVEMSKDLVIGGDRFPGTDLRRR